MKWKTAIMMIVACSATARAFESLESDYRTNGSLMHAVVTRANQSLQEFSAVVYDGKKEIGYGIVITEDGYILGKWSELKNAGALSVRVGGELYDTVEISAQDARWDVCLLKIEAGGLKPVVYADSSDIGQGSWVVANGATSRTERRPMIGVVSANSREIRAEGGAVLGVEIKEGDSGIVAGKVPEISGAYKAGIRDGDKIISVGDREIHKREDLVEFMKDRRVGEKIEVGYQRDGVDQKTLVELMGRADTFGAEESRNDAMSGDVSKRRSGFPRVIQHDIGGTSKTVGGPLLDLDGKCIGMNIARANRAESYAIPVEELRQISQSLLDQAKK
jgi:serine protease Do